MKTTRRIIFLLLTLYLPAAFAEGDNPSDEPPTRTFKLHTEFVYIYMLPDCYDDPSSMIINLQCTLGDSFYGGPTLTVIADWSHAYYIEKPLPSIDYALGLVGGFNFLDSGIVSFHAELAICAKTFLEDNEIWGFVRLNAGPAFDLGNGWRISAEIDCSLFRIGGGIGLSYSY